MGKGALRTIRSVEAGDESMGKLFTEFQKNGLHSLESPFFRFFIWTF